MLWPTQLMTLRLRWANIGASTVFIRVSPVLPSLPAWSEPVASASSAEGGDRGAQARGEVDVGVPAPDGGQGVERAGREELARRHRRGAALRVVPALVDVARARTGARCWRRSGRSGGRSIRPATNAARSAAIRSTACGRSWPARASAQSPSRDDRPGRAPSRVPGRTRAEAAARSSRQAAIQLGLEDARIPPELLGRLGERASGGCHARRRRSRPARAGRGSSKVGQRR